MNSTVRRYPRTLGEAFRDATYACAITRPAESLLGRLVDMFAWAVAAALLVGMVFAPFIWNLQ